MIWYDIYIYIYLTANELTPGGSSKATFTQKQYTEYKERNIHSNHKMWSVKCGPCPVCASYTLAFALQLREKHGKTSVRVHKKNYKLFQLRALWLIWVALRIVIQVFCHITSCPLISRHRKFRFVQNYPKNLYRFCFKEDVCSGSSVIL